jgi:hypothetical protein
MRLELEKEAVAISFKKLYEEANDTRLTVTKKLREIMNRHKAIKKLKIEEEEPGHDLASRTRKGATPDHSWVYNPDPEDTNHFNRKSAEGDTRKKVSPVLTADK